MPPPNITGRLHMGHALFLTLQDSLHRHWKTLGHTSLWLPGLDHAGLATYEKIEKHQKSNSLSYEESAKFIEDSHRSIILDQIRKIGALPDWSKLTYTLDEDYQDFIHLLLQEFIKEDRISFKDGQFYLDLKDYALELLEDLKAGEITIIPDHELKNLKPFLENLEPWCISRQIPWGTKIPLQHINGKICYLKGSSEDSLDTWLNSSLWTLAPLLKNPELIEKFYPATLIETGADILFFWCARMLMMGNFIYKHQDSLGLKLNAKYPFYTIYLHGIIRDKKGQKFSKSLGNGIDPLLMIEKYGPDATRLFLATRSGAAEDIKFDEQELIIYKKFINKIYQSARFFSMYANKAGINKLSSLDGGNYPQELIQLQEKYIGLMGEYRFLEASRLIHSQFKSWFCDKWIEDNKNKIQQLDDKTIILGIKILDQLLGMMEPFCPFICNELKLHFYKEKI